jgi:hypothetical protein
MYRADSSADPDTPIDLIPNSNPCYRRRPPTKSIINNIVPPFSNYFSLFAILSGTVNYSTRFLNFPLSHTAIAILVCYSSTISVAFALFDKKDRTPQSFLLWNIQSKHQLF